MSGVRVVDVGVPGPSGSPSLAPGALVTDPGDLIAGGEFGAPVTLQIGAARTNLREKNGMPAWLPGTGFAKTIASDDAPDWVKDLADDVCDGVDDDVQINGAINTYGHVRLSAGRFFTSAPVLMDDYQTLRGMGAGATVLFLASNANCAVIEGVDFATLDAGDTTGGPAFWEVSDLEIDANVANQPDPGATEVGRGGHCIRVYARNYRLSRLILHHSNGFGVSTKWSTNATPPVPHSMEARITDVEIHDCALNAIMDQGPHDKIVRGCIFWANGQAGVSGRTYAVHVYSSRANGSQYVDCHPWGPDHEWCYVIDAANVQINGGIVEGGAVGQIYVGGADPVITPGLIYGASIPSTKGIVIAASATGYRIATEVRDCPGAALDYASDGGSGRIELLVRHASGAAVIGTPHATRRRDIFVVGGGTGTVNE